MSDTVIDAKPANLVPDVLSRISAHSIAPAQQIAPRNWQPAISPAQA